MNNITIFFVSLKCKQKNKTLCYPTTKLLKFSIWQTTSAFFNETVKKHSIDDGKKHRNKPSRLSDSEIMTILIMFHMGGFRCLKHFYVNYICKHCGLVRQDSSPQTRANRINQWRTEEYRTDWTFKASFVLEFHC